MDRNIKKKDLLLRKSKSGLSHLLVGSNPVTSAFLFVQLRLLAPRGQITSNNKNQKTDFCCWRTFACRSKPVATAFLFAYKFWLWYIFIGNTTDNSWKEWGFIPTLSCLLHGLLRDLSILLL